MWIFVIFYTFSGEFQVMEYTKSSQLFGLEISVGRLG
jgi:hypothetical protein